VPHETIISNLVVETPKANLVDGMKWLLGTYLPLQPATQTFRHLFSGRYKSLFVDGSGNGYLKTVCDYVHLNAARAKLLSAKEKLRAFRWSSYGSISKPRGNGYLVTSGIGCSVSMGSKDTAAGREQFEARMEWRRDSEDGEDFKEVERGWCLGSEAFRKELLAQRSQQPERSITPGNPRIGPGKGRTDNCRRTETNGLGRIGSERHRKRRSAEAKNCLAPAAANNDDTGVDCARLQMGTKTHLSHLLYWDERGRVNNTKNRPL